MSEDWIKARAKVHAAGYHRGSVNAPDAFEHFGREVANRVESELFDEIKLVMQRVADRRTPICDAHE